MATQHVNSFIQLVDSFRKNPFSFLMMVLLVGTIYLVWTQGSRIEERLFPDPQVESVRFRESMQRDLVVNKALDNARIYLDADVVTLSQFHNGSYDLTTVPFTLVSATYLAGKSELDAEPLYEARPLSSINRTMLEMWADKDNPICMDRLVENLADPQYQDRMETLGLNFVVLCPVTNVLNYPIGYILVGYKSIPGEADIPLMRDYTRTQSTKVSGYLQEGVVEN